MASATLSRSAKALPQGSSRLSQILERLNQEPRLQLPNVTNFKIRWNARNNTFGARYFVKDALPRIRWANPSLDIEADKVWGNKTRQNIELTFTSGQRRTIEMDQKWSTAIIKELMDAAGGDAWVRYKNQRKEEGLPVLSGGENAYKLLKAQTLKRVRTTKPIFTGPAAS